ncbi:MAG: hypothetical protein VX976_00470 [Pseudomonadota bacterium]|nr:hypothetical protein [Pseudomonadota bacterium]
MDEESRKKIWALIQNQGDYLKEKLKPHPNHPKGRNPYAHICGLIADKYNCSYKNIPNEKIGDLVEFISKIED